MSNPLKALSRLLSSQSAPRTGTVSAVVGDQITVVTDTGVVHTAALGSTAYKEGDGVRLQNGVIIGKVRPEADLPVYYV